MNDLKELYRKRREITLAIMHKIKEMYPIGMLVSVQLGGHELVIRVTGYNKCWWSRLDEIYGVSNKTGKPRTFVPYDIIDNNQLHEH